MLTHTGLNADVGWRVNNKQLIKNQEAADFIIRWHLTCK